MSDAAPSRRLLSLDAFRGATIASMLLVNNHAVWTSPPIPLQLMHNPWHGCTFTDLIFPFFLFIVGVAMPFSDARRRAEGETFREAWRHAFRRAVVIFALGTFLTSVRWAAPTLVLEVLQRIALCYFLAFAVLRAPAAVQAGAAGALFFAYWALMVWVRAPGVPWEHRWDAGQTLAQHVDDCILGRFPHLPHDEPTNEGLVSTLPAIANVIFGIMVGNLLLGARPPIRKVGILVGAGLVGLSIGWLFSAGLPPDSALWIPLNKVIWTPSYAVFTTGWACLVLAAFYAAIDMARIKAWAWPLVVYGSNALGVYAFTRLVQHWILRVWMIRTGSEGVSGPKEVSLKMWIFGHTSQWFGEMWGSLAYSVLVVMIGFAFCWWLWRRKIFLKV